MHFGSGSGLAEDGSKKGGGALEDYNLTFWGGAIYMGGEFVPNCTFEKPAWNMVTNQNVVPKTRFLKQQR